MSLMSRRRILQFSGLMAAGAMLPMVGGCKAQPVKSNLLDPKLKDIHQKTFNFFWETTDAKTGLAPDNWPNPDFCSIAAVGFALSAYAVGVKNGYVKRVEAAERTLTTLKTFWNGKQGPETQDVMGYKGFFYHFLGMETGTRHDKCELSSIDTALFICGALTAASFFDANDPIEKDIRETAKALYERIDWTFMARENGLVSMGWHPEITRQGNDSNGLITRNWDRYNEGMMIYLLGLASPTHAINPKVWSVWADTIDGTWGPNLGEPHIGFSPLFGHQYSHIYYDFRAIADPYMRKKGIDYFENSRRATIAQQNYARANPHGFKDYSADIWGLTACRGPKYIKAPYNGHEVQFNEYGARGPDVGDGESFDDGTLAPTAVGGSVPFAPEICLKTLTAMIDRYGTDLVGQYGFFDAFNPSFPHDVPSKTGQIKPRAGWVSNEYLGIDQGPILLMLENYQSSLIWDLFNRSHFNGPAVLKAFHMAEFQSVGEAGKWLNH